MIPAMTHWVTDFYRQNEWANLTLIEACRPLHEAQLDATAEGTYGSIRDTLRHIVSAEAGYALRLGVEPSARLQRDDPWPGLDGLAEMVTAAADALAEAALGDPAAVIRGGSAEKPYDIEAVVILIQAFHHSTEHRSQICTVLTTLGIEPPELSSWDWGLATGRMLRA
jgi:uncharacterized damage-inducible protein DinB